MFNSPSLAGMVWNHWRESCPKKMLGWYGWHDGYPWKRARHKHLKDLHPHPIFFRLLPTFSDAPRVKGIVNHGINGINGQYSFIKLCVLVHWADPHRPKIDPNFEIPKWCCVSGRWPWKKVSSWTPSFARWRRVQKHSCHQQWGIG